MTSSDFRAIVFFLSIGGITGSVGVLCGVAPAVLAFSLCLFIALLRK